MKSLLTFNSNRIIRAFFIISLVFIFTSLAGQFIVYILKPDSEHLIKFIDSFFLGYEMNFPTYFISMLNLFSALLLLFISILKKREHGAYVLQWRILAYGFFFISADEIAQFHERLIDPIAGAFGDKDLGVFTFAWVIPGIVIVILLGIAYYKFLLDLDKKTKVFFFSAAALFVGGAIGFELLGGRYYAIHGAQNFIYRLFQTIEESMEMIGLTVFIWGLLRYISQNYKSVELDFK